MAWRVLLHRPTRCHSPATTRWIRSPCDSPSTAAPAVVAATAATANVLWGLGREPPPTPPTLHNGPTRVCTHHAVTAAGTVLTQHGRRRSLNLHGACVSPARKPCQCPAEGSRQYAAASGKDKSPGRGKYPLLSSRGLLWCAQVCA